MSDEQPQDKWGDPVSKERQQELLGMLEAWDAPGTDRRARKGPFDRRESDLRLTGADVSWLAEQVRTAEGSVPDLHLEGADLSEAHLEGADLRRAHLEGASLNGAQLKGAVLRAAHLEGALLTEANLEGAYLDRSWLDSKTILSDATLDNKTKLGDIQWSGVGAVNLPASPGSVCPCWAMSTRCACGVRARGRASMRR
jgi:hypothetical protein